MTISTDPKEAVKTITTSKQYRLNYKDLLKGLLVAAISPVVPIVMQSVNAGSFVFDWKAIGTTALGAAIAYLVKNFLTPAQTVISGGQQPPPGTRTVPPNSKVSL